MITGKMSFMLKLDGQKFTSESIKEAKRRAYQGDTKEYLFFYKHSGIQTLVFKLDELIINRVVCLEISYRWQQYNWN